MIRTNVNWEILSLTRFILAMIVALAHVPEALNNLPSSNWPFYSRIGAFEAVLGFLLISGYSIGTSIQKNQSSYLKRRLHRIYPIYFGTLILYFIVTENSLNWHLLYEFLVNMLFLNNVVTSQSYIVVAWTLALEVWLYLLAPFFFKLDYKRKMQLAYGSFLVFLLYTMGRTLFHFPYHTTVSYGLNLPLLAFIWLIGFIYPLHPNKGRFIRLSVLVFFIGYMGLTVAIEMAHQYKHYHQLTDFVIKDLKYFVSQSLVLGLVYVSVFYSHKIESLSFNTRRTFTILGNISYPFYLTHRLVFVFLNEHNFNNTVISILLAVAVSYIQYLLFDFYTRKRVVSLQH
jgi:peptidoglycan/LPS O-acetylase OafA/YrhL